MDLNTFFVALPIFLVAYKGAGLLLNSQAEPDWDPSKVSRRTSSAQHALKEFTALSAKLGFNRVLLRHKPFGDRLDLLLLRSGYPFGWKTEDLLFCKELTALLLLAFAWHMASDQPALWMLGLILGFWLPDAYIRSKGTARRAAIQRLLPGFVDLTALALESGLDLMAAVERILEKMKPGSLKEELAMLLQENRLGTSP